MVLSANRANTTLRVGALLIVLYAGSFSLAATGKMYWTAFERGEISRANLDGSNPTVLLRTLGPYSIEVDPVHGRMYWAEGTSVYRANTDGSGAELLFTLFAVPDIHLAVDGTNGKLYYGHGIEESTGLIGWADLDGSNQETLLYDVTTADIELDVSGGKLVFTFYDPFTELRAIRQADLDGNDVETLFELDDFAKDIALDPSNGKIYWSNHEIVSDTIMRANLDGTDPEILIPDLHDVYHVEIDLDHGKIYYTQGDLDIRRANLDGSGDEPVVSGLSPGGLALDPLAEGGGVPALTGRGGALLAMLLLIVSTALRSRF